MMLSFLRVHTRTAKAGLVRDTGSNVLSLVRLEQPLLAWPGSHWLCPTARLGPGGIFFLIRAVLLQKKVFVYSSNGWCSWSSDQVASVYATLLSPPAESGAPGSRGWHPGYGDLEKDTPPWQLPGAGLRPQPRELVEGRTRALKALGLSPGCL